MFESHLCIENCATLNSFFSSRRQLWRQEDTLKKERVALREKLASAERDLHGSVGKHVFQGLETIREIMKTTPLPGYYGPLIQLVCPH